MSQIQDKTVLYLTDLPLGFTIEDIQIFLTNYKDKIRFISLDQNKRMMEKRKNPAVKVIFIDSESANACRIEMNLRKIKGKSVRIMWDERDTAIRYNTTSNLFVKGIPKSVTPREVYEYFYKFGDISSAKINEDENGNHLGYGYITYYNAEDEKKAIEETNGKQIWNSVIEVNHFQKKNERGFNEMEQNNQKLYINNLPENFEESELRKLCEKYGTVKGCNIFMDNVGKNFGIVQFSSEKEAREILPKLDGQEVNGNKLTVKLYQNTYEHKQYIQNNSAKINEKCQGCNLIIKNIPLNATEKDLLNAFEKFGKIQSVKIEKEQRDKDSKDKVKSKTDIVSKGFGYLLFDNEASANNALNSMNYRFLPGFESWNKPLDIEIFRTKRERHSLENRPPAPTSGNGISVKYFQKMPPQGIFGAYPPTFFPGQPMPPMPVQMKMQPPFPYGGRPFPPMMGPAFGGYNNYYRQQRGGRFNNRGRPRGRFNNFHKGGYNNYNNSGHYQRGRQNQNPHYQRGEQNSPEEKNKINENTSKSKYDIEELEKMDENDRKEFLGEELYKAISESPIITENNHPADTVSKITGMIVELPDIKEIIEALENTNILNGRIEEALDLLKKNE